MKFSYKICLELAEYDVDGWYYNFESIGEHVDLLPVNCSSLPGGSTSPYQTSNL